MRRESPSTGLDDDGSEESKLIGRGLRSTSVSRIWTDDESAKSLQRGRRRRRTSFRSSSPLTSSSSSSSVSAAPSAVPLRKTSPSSRVRYRLWSMGDFGEATLSTSKAVGTSGMAIEGRVGRAVASVG